MNLLKKENPPGGLTSDLEKMTLLLRKMGNPPWRAKLGAKKMQKRLKQTKPGKKSNEQTSKANKSLVRIDQAKASNRR